MSLWKKYSVHMLIGLAILLGLILVFQTRSQLLEGFETKVAPEKIHDLWYINLTRSKDRNESVLKEAKKLEPLVPNRFEAIDGKLLTSEDYEKLDIPAWARPEFAREDRQVIRKGEIGCFLSHRNLMEKLQTINAPPDSGHLVLEDDIAIAPDFVKKWNETAKHLNPNWDIVTFGLTGEKHEIENVQNNLGRPRWINNNYAYLVKHSSVPKVLQATKVMSEPFDTILGRNMDKLNIYAFTPPLVTPRKNNNTTMAGEN